MGKTKIILVLIILLASLLRFWDLGKVPISPDWDEVALGYNAYSVMQTGRDEYGEFLPIILRSFDDYKPAFYMYLIMPFIVLLDLSVLAVRLPSAIMGVVTVAAMYFLVKELFASYQSVSYMQTSPPPSPKRRGSFDDASERRGSWEGWRINSNGIALLSAFLLAISPWHIQFSRIAFETNVGLAFNVLMVLCFIIGLKKPWLLTLSGIFGALSIYTYQSEKVFTPLLLFGMGIIFFNELRKVNKKYFITAIVVGAIVISPMAFETLTNKEALARARGVSIFSEKTTLLKENTERLIRDNARKDYLGKVFNNRRIVYAKTIVANYISHFDPVWLFIKGDYGVNRHHVPGMGLLYLVELPFLIMGIYALAFGRFSRKTKALLIYWILIAPIPASITTGVPHAVRTLNMLPPLIICVGLGVMASIQLIGKYKVLSIKYYVFLLSTFFFILYTLNVSYYLNQYFVQQNYYYALDWQYGYEKLVKDLQPLQRNFDQVIVSNRGEMSQSYMFFLFYTKYDPHKYLKEGGTSSGGFAVQANKFDRYEFRVFDLTKESGENKLFVGAPSDFAGSFSPLHSIHYPDGKEAMRIASKEDE